MQLLASGGISTGPIRALALKLLTRYQPNGKLLDYGAGTGDLLKQLHSEFNYDEISGVDIQERPENLSEEIKWFQQDLNDEFVMEEKFDVVVSTDVIEHLENPRATFRNIFGLLKPGGVAVITTPNQNSIRSIVALAVGGHFVAFLGASYPAHITALTKLDLLRISKETNFDVLDIHYSDDGGIPKLPQLKWQSISFGLFKGRLFSDNVGIVIQKKESLSL